MFTTPNAVSLSSPRASLLTLGFVAALVTLSCASGGPRAEGPLDAPSALPLERTCPGGTVTTRAELTAFEGCTKVLGDLKVASSDFTHLRQLAELTSVSGSLEVSNNCQLRSLSGLERLRHASSLRLLDNPRLASLRALGSLVHLEHLEVVRAPLLRSSRGLEGLTKLKSLTLNETGLARVAGLAHVARIERIEIGDNPYLISLAPLGNVRRVARLEVYKNRWLNGSPREFFPELTHTNYARIEGNVAFSPSERERAQGLAPRPSLPSHGLLAKN